MSGRNPNSAPFQTPKYLHDFTKALAGEVRVLLEEVGQLREERRGLQYEVAQLMNLKYKHGAGGEYAPDWQPKIEAPPPPPPPEAPPPPPPNVRAPPAWRTVQNRPGRGERRFRNPPASMPPPGPTLVPLEPPRPELPAWQNWRPNPLLAPPPVLNPTGLSLPPQQRGLFGPPTPPPNK